MKNIVAVSLCASVLAAFATYAVVVSRPSDATQASNIARNAAIEASALSIDQIPGVRWPRHLPANKVALADDLRVLGVCVNGVCRAYAVPVLSLVESHIVNDVIDEVPITVTYCDLVDCARVVTAPQRGAPLDLSVGGIDANQQLILLLDDDRYPQLSDQLPLDDYPFELTTWGEWRESHPDTLVYVGQATQSG